MHVCGHVNVPKGAITSLSCIDTLVSDRPRCSLYALAIAIKERAHLGCDPAHAAVSGPVHVQDGIYIAEGKYSNMAVPAPAPAMCQLPRVPVLLSSDDAIALSNQLDDPVAVVKHTRYSRVWPP